MARWQLNTLGRLTIERTDAPPSSDAPAAPSTIRLRDFPEVSPRALALLAVLARAGERGVNRDRLLLFFWGESRVERARNALRQTLFRLRRDLDEPELVAGTTELRLNPGVITTDVAAFEQALDAGALENAAALYGGPFLKGLVVGDAPELDEWVCAERERLAKRFAAAVEALASAADARGDHHESVAWWRKLAAADPTNARVALGLMTALAHVGDRVGALQYYRLHELLLQEELGVTPDETVVALVHRLREPPRDAEPVTGTGGTGTVDFDPAPKDRRRAGSGRARPLAWSRGTQAAALVAVALLMTTTLWLRGRAASGAEPLARRESVDMIAVLPFADHSGAATAGTRSVGEQVTDLLSALVDGAGGLRAVDPHATRGAIGEDRGRDTADPATDPAVAKTVAQRLGADRFVLGEVAASASTLRVTAVLYESARGLDAPPARFIVQGDTAHIDALTEELAKQLLAALHPEPAEHLSHVAAEGTRSFAAFKAYVNGEHRLARGEYGPAVDDFRSAAVADSNFALAWYRLAVAADWGGRAESYDVAATRAQLLSERLQVRERTLLRAFVAWHRGDANEAERLYRILITQYPDDAEAWYQLCETEFHLGPVFGRSVLDATHSCERAVALHPGDREPLVHLLRLAAKADDRRRVDTLANQLLSTATQSDSVAVNTLRAFAIGDADDKQRALTELQRSADETVLHAAIKVGVYTEDLSGAARIARLLTDNVRGESYRHAGAAYEAFLLAARGQLSAAIARLESAETLTDGQRTGLRAIAAVVPLVPFSRATFETLRDTLRRWRTPADSERNDLSERLHLTSPRYRGFALGLVNVRLGDSRAAEAAARELEDDAAVTRLSPIGRAIAHDLAQVVRAETARASGDRKEALALASSESTPYPGLGQFEGIVGSRAYQRYLRAELLRELGHDEEALRWYASIGGVSVPELIFLAPAALRQAEILERRGDRDRARVEYRRFLRLWRDCDPELRPIVVEAARRLGRLAPVTRRVRGNE